MLVIVDAHSKWLEALTVSTATSQSTIEKLRSIFATHGLPEVLMSDNGTAFTSAEFAAFTEANGIKHLRSAPYHPASNGLADRAVPTLKAAIKKSGSGVPYQHRSLVFVPVSPDAPLHGRSIARGAVGEQKTTFQARSAPP